MIYLIQDCYKNDSGEYVDILKIGYSDKPFNQSRNNQYKTHNYGYKFIGEREGDTRFEHYLHEKYKDFRLSPDTEWFLYNQTIVDEFFIIDENEVNIVLTKEQYVFQVREYLLSTITKPTELYSKYATGLIEALSKEPGYDIEEKEIYEDRIYNTFEFVYSLVSEEIKSDCVYSNEFFNNIPERIDSVWLAENPWKNRAELFYRLNTKSITQEAFQEFLEKKKKRTDILLNIYYNNTTNPEDRHELADNYQFVAKSRRYRNDFVAVNEHAGSDLVPVFNKLVMISEMRAFDVQQVDYKDRFSVFSTLSKSVDEIDDVNLRLDELYSHKHIPDKLRYLCSLDESMANSLLPHLPESLVNYYTVLGAEKIKALRYNTTDIKRAYEGIMGNQSIDIKPLIISEFKVEEIYSKAEVKKKLAKIYKDAGYTKTPRAVDLGDYFIIKNCMITNKETGKRDNCYKIVSIKSE